MPGFPYPDASWYFNCFSFFSLFINKFYHSYCFNVHFFDYWWCWTFSPYDYGPFVVLFCEMSCLWTWPIFQLVSYSLIVLKLDVSTWKGPLPPWELGKWLEVLVFTCWFWKAAASVAPEAGANFFPSQNSNHRRGRSKGSLGWVHFPTLHLCKTRAVSSPELRRGHVCLVVYQEPGLVFTRACCLVLMVRMPMKPRRQWPSIRAPGAPISPSLWGSSLPSWCRPARSSTIARMSHSFPCLWNNTGSTGLSQRQPCRWGLGAWKWGHNRSLAVPAAISSFHRFHNIYCTFSVCHVFCWGLYSHSYVSFS